MSRARPHKSKIKLILAILLTFFLLLFILFRSGAKNKNSAVQISEGFVLSPLKNGSPTYKNAWVVSTDGKTKSPYLNQKVTNPYPNSEHLTFDEKRDLEDHFRQKIGKTSDSFYGIMAYEKPGKEYIFYSYPEADQKNFGEIWNRRLEIWRYNSQIDEAKKILSSYRYDNCSHVIKWEPENHEIITSIELPVSSEEYTKGFCLIDDETGRIKNRFIIPNYKSQDYYYVFPYIVNNKLLIDHSSDLGKSEVYLFDFETMEFKDIRPLGWDDYSISKSLKDGDVLLYANRGQDFVVFNMNAQSFRKPFSIKVRDPQSTYISTSDIYFSPDFKYAAFEEFMSDRQRCYWVYDLQESEPVSKTCDKDLQISEGKYVEYHFAGWLSQEDD